MSSWVSGEYIDVWDGLVKMILGNQSTIEMFTAVNHLKMSEKLSDRAVRHSVPRIPWLWWPCGYALPADSSRLTRDTSYRTIFCVTLTALYYLVIVSLFDSHVRSLKLYFKTLLLRIFSSSRYYEFKCSFRLPTRSQFRKPPSRPPLPRGPGERVWSSCNWIWTFLSWEWNQMPRLI